MMKRAVLWMVPVCFASLSLWPSVAAAQAATPTPGGPRMEAFEEANVRAGPGTFYDQVGRVVPGQTAPILGKVTTPQWTWLKIVYFGGPNNEGWVVQQFVRVSGDLATVPELIEIPPTPTLPPTPTIPFGEITITPAANANRSPTFTPPAIVARPTLLPPQGVTPTGGTFPPALAIIGLFVLGVLLAGVSVVRGRG